MREHRPADHVADRIDAGNIGGEPVIDCDPAVLIACDADCFKPETRGVRPPADRDHSHIRHKALLLGAVELQGQIIRSGLYPRNLGGEFEVDPRSREHALQSRAELAVHARDDWSSTSTTVTVAPSRCHTEPSSSPM